MENPAFEEIQEDPKNRVEININYEKEMEELDKSKRKNPYDSDSESELVDNPEAGDNFMQKFAKWRDYPFKKMSENPKWTKGVLLFIFACLYNAWFIGVWMRYEKFGLSYEWCDGLGVVIILNSVVYFFIFYYQVVVRFFGDFLNENVILPFSKLISTIYSKRFASILTYIILIAAIATFLVIDSKDEPERLISGAGLLIILVFGFIFSAHPGHVRWRPVAWGITLEFILGLIVLRWPTGQRIFQCIGDKVSLFLSYTDAGSSFVFGYLSSQTPLIPSNIEVLNDPNKTAEYQAIATAFNTPSSEGGFPFDSIFMFKSLSVIYFFAFCVSMLFYIGALQWVVMKLGWMLYVTMGTTAAESLNAAANIFLGQTEAPLLIKPFLPLMTKSEIHAVMTGGFATIAGTVLAAYISFGIDAANLISASVMAAPAALAFSKLFYPETEKSKTSIKDIKLEKGDEANILDAAAQGASTAIMLVFNIGASIIAFLAFVAFLNAIVAWMGELAGVEGLTFDFILGKVLAPVAFILGVPLDDCEEVGRLIGLKTMINEFAAFQELGVLIDNDAISERAATIATFALCGFANLGSIGIQLGGLGAMSPERRSDLAQVVIRAFVAGCVTSMMNACVAGSLISSSS